MEKTCVAEKKRTTDNMWVEKRKRKEKKKKRKKKGGGREVPRTERSPMMCKKNMTKKRWLDRLRDFFDFMYHQPHRVTPGHW